MPRYSNRGTFSINATRFAKAAISFFTRPTSLFTNSRITAPNSLHRPSLSTGVGAGLLRGSASSRRSRASSALMRLSVLFSSALSLALHVLRFQRPQLGHYFRVQLMHAHFLSPSLVPGRDHGDATRTKPGPATSPPRVSTQQTQRCARG